MSPMLAATETNRIAGEARSGETYSECVGNASCAWKLREPSRRCRCARVPHSFTVAFTVAGTRDEVSEMR